MAYQTGTATDSDDLLQKIVAWLSGIGWTINKNASGFAHVSKNGVFVNLCITSGNVNPWGHTLSSAPSSTMSALHLYVGSGYAGSALWNAQPGGPQGFNQTFTVGLSARLTQNAIESYCFYSDAADNICIVFEAFPTIYSHIGWGRLNKAGEYTGGEYFFAPLASDNFAMVLNAPGNALNALCPATQNPCDIDRGAIFIRADVDTYIDKWLSSCGSNSSYAVRGYTGRNAVSSVIGSTLNNSPAAIATYHGMQDRTVTQATMAVTLLPVMLWTPRDAGSGYSLLGAIPGVFATDAASTTKAGPVAPGTLIKYGADEYVLYPYFAIKREA